MRDEILKKFEDFIKHLKKDLEYPIFIYSKQFGYSKVLGNEEMESYNAARLDIANKLKKDKT